MAPHIKDGFTSFKIEEDQIRNYWPMVKEGVERVISKSNPTFIAEDVYMKLSTNMAWLIITFEKKTKEYAGFVIVSRAKEDKYSKRQDLLIWQAYSKIKGAVESTLPKVEDMAKGLGFDCVIFYSSRRGWTRRADSLGFKIREIAYSKQL